VRLERRAGSDLWTQGGIAPRTIRDNGPSIAVPKSVSQWHLSRTGWSPPELTKGCGVHPADKRLAIQTDDCLLVSFYGTIPKGQYGGGTVMLWNRGTGASKDD
jgi:hypothetical protein